MAPQEGQNIVSHLVLDTGGLIKSSATLRKVAQKFYTVPRVLAELKDENSKKNLELWGDSIEVKVPEPEFIKKVSEFAKRTGDYAFLSATDLQVLALTYELEYKNNGGDWRLRSFPGQKKINGPPPVQETASVSETAAVEAKEVAATTEKLEQLNLSNEKSESDNSNAAVEPKEQEPSVDQVEEEDEGDDDDEEGWITPSNLKKVRAREAEADSVAKPVNMKVACITTDFAMQNVLLQIGLNLVSADGLKIQKVKQFVLRCHGCFAIERNMEKKFCRSCGGNTLLKAACSVNSKGEFRVHLKKNFEWKVRGTKYSLPKPVHGSANGKSKKNPILREDQPEYQRAVRYAQRKKERDLMDQDFLPSILTNDRREDLRIVIGAGKRNPNEVRKFKKRQ
ncbi:ribosome biogenesis protein Nob1 [Schizosaccharomyces japonicus yFS275]|uniref:20S-pre-rRNA D-site endonuclease NOB1 n=1 Tax=Schizosaccharomyces japonicus (strain yFS275 / FY16936) TaxID=402676 RepID=B6K4H8_SCHJY|nr:ribosome biogenesis protein Nob1 [Schizosaccharomyces japonicus yFS275]EEB08385.1 ribosome biogenesis protein Nob1 [Schizosaccharomyces japonicus yFS275]